MASFREIGTPDPEKEATVEEVQRSASMPTLEIAETAPRFEDAFIDLLGGAATAESPLGEIIHRVEGTADETVIEAQSLTKNSATSPPPTTSIFASNAGKFSACLAPTAPANPPPLK
jgi:ABC-2 type transport system ATP-binding protein